MSDTTPTDGGALDVLDDTLTLADQAAPAASDEERKKKRRKILAFLLALMLLLTGAIVAWYLMTRKPLTQLPGVTVVPLPTYKMAFYGVEKPLGVGVSPDASRIYATQGGSKPTTLVFDRDGNKIGELKPPADSGTFHVPVYIAVGADGRVYVGDRAIGAVYIYDGSGTYVSTFAPKDKSVHFSPLGVAVAADGTLYIADVASDKPADHRILVFSPDGTLIKTLGKGQLNYPNELVADGQNIYVTDSNAGRLVLIDGSDKLTTLVQHGVGEGDLGLPRGLGIDDQGRIFVVDATDHMVRMYTKAATPTAPPPFAGSFGDQGVADGQFLYPNGLAVDSRARVYVADRENNRIQVWGF